MFKANAPPPPPAKPPTGTKKPALPAYSHYLQSKVVRARERIEAELAAEAEAPSPSPTETQPPAADKTAPSSTESEKSS